MHVPRGLNISEFIHRWISSEKYPIVNVQRINGSIILHQSSHTEDDDSSQKSLWNIPISFTNSTAKNFSSGFEYWLMEDNFTVIHNAYDKNDPLAWCLINNGFGYYRVNYDYDNWIAIVRQLRDDHNVFPYTTRAILIDDVLNLARMNLLNYTIAFDLLSYLMAKDELTLHPWLRYLFCAFYALLQLKLTLLNF